MLLLIPSQVVDLYYQPRLTCQNTNAAAAATGLNGDSASAASPPPSLAGSYQQGITWFAAGCLAKA